MTDRAWYFVSHLIDGDMPGATGPFEVQVLNEVGQGVEVGYFTPPCLRLVVAGHEIPPAVLQAASRLPLGFGYYVGASGEWLDGWGKPAPPLPEDREQLARMLLETAQRLIRTRVSAGQLRLRAVVDHYGETVAAGEARALLQSPTEA
jgi:hypothetical protein